MERVTSGPSSSKERMSGRVVVFQASGVLRISCNGPVHWHAGPNTSVQKEQPVQIERAALEWRLPFHRNGRPRVTLDSRAVAVYSIIAGPHPLPPKSSRCSPSYLHSCRRRRRRRRRCRASRRQLLRAKATTAQALSWSPCALQVQVQPMAPAQLQVEAAEQNYEITVFSAGQLRVDPARHEIEDIGRLAYEAVQTGGGR